jgi:tetratricopeptide (TPR) repeat protein/TolB-like protein/predicted Ser/Thr protein kinase
MKCPACGAEASEDQVECAACGEVLLGQDGEETRLEQPTAGTPGTVPVRDIPTIAIPSRTPTPGVTPSRRDALPTGVSGPGLGGGAILPKGSVLAGRYRVEEVLGQGGMGVVYRARDLELDRDIAVKTLRTDQEDNQEVIERFKRELLAARKITHKNVIRIHDMGEAEGLRFFTMECIPGRSLKRLIKDRGRLPVEEALSLARPILSALDEAHSQGVVHRDLKPQNIMVSEAGVPYVMDFGIAWSSEASQLTATGAVVGTPDYMSPEQVQGSSVGPQADLYSFGIILYEMLTGDLPYKGDSTASKLVARLTERAPSPRTLNAEIPGYLEHVVLKCLERSPQLRYASAAEIVNDLDRTAVDRSVTLHVLDQARQHRGALIGSAIAVLAVVGTYLSTRDRPPPEEEAVAVRTLAVLPLTNATGADRLEWVRNGVPDMLFTDIAQSRFVRPLPPERVASVLRQLGVADQTRLDESTLQEIATRAGADSVLYGMFLESGDRLRFDLVLRESGVGVGTPIKAEAAVADVVSLVDDITERVKEQLVGADRLRGDEDRPVAQISTASLDARRAFQAGTEELRRGANQSAAELLAGATAADPEFAMAWARLAEAYLETGEHREAAAAIERAVTLAEQKALPLPERYRIHATAASVGDDYEKAAESLGRLAELYPRDPDIRMSLARAFERLGRPQDALSAYQAVLEQEQGHPAALLGLGRTQVMTGHAKEAIASLGSALETGAFSEDVEALGMIHSILGVARRETGDLPGALEELEKSLELRRQAGDQRGQATTLMNIASVHEFTGDLRNAAAVQQQALELHREMGNRVGESNVLNEMGNTRKAGGDLPRALEYFRESMQIETERGDHLALAQRLDQIADVYRLMGRYDDAMVYLDQARTHLADAHEPREQAINLNYTGLVRRAQGLYGQALEALLAARPLFEESHQEMGSAALEVNLAGIFMEQGRYADAYASLRKSAEIYEHIHHDLAEVHIPMGFLAIALGKPDVAEQQFEAASHSHGAHHESLGPDLLLGQAAIADLRGDAEAAAAAFEQANIQANLSGRKEVAVRSRIELGRLYLAQGKGENAVRLLTRTRQEAREARLRPLEAAAGVGLARALLAQRDAAGSRDTARDAIDLAGAFEGRPVLYRAYAVLGEALEELGRDAEAVDAFAKGAAALEWIRSSLRPEHVASFVGRGDVREFVDRTSRKLEELGRTAEAGRLREALAAPPESEHHEDAVESGG